VAMQQRFVQGRIGTALNLRFERSVLFILGVGNQERDEPVRPAGSDNDIELCRNDTKEVSTWKSKGSYARGKLVTERNFVERDHTSLCTELW
jgi:hypothetical protein